MFIVYIFDLSVYSTKKYFSDWLRSVVLMRFQPHSMHAAGPDDRGKGRSSLLPQWVICTSSAIQSSLRAHRLLPHGSPATPAAWPSWGHSERLQETRASTELRSWQPPMRRLSPMSNKWKWTRYIMWLSLLMLQRVSDKDLMFFFPQDSRKHSLNCINQNWWIFQIFFVLLHWHSVSYKRKYTAIN